MSTSKFMGILFFISMLGTIGSIIFLIYKQIKKQPKKPASIALVSCIIATIVFSVLMTFTMTPEEQATMAEKQAQKQAAELAKKEADELARKEENNAKQNIESETTATENETSSSSTQEQTYNIGLAPEEFKNNFNALSQNTAADTGLLISNLKVETGEVQNVFQVTFNQKLAMTGTVNKNDNMIRDISIIAQPTNNATHNLNLILAFGYLIGSVSPELTPDERGQVLKELGFMDKDADLTKLDGKVLRGNVQYSASFMQGIGFFFNAKNVNDQ